MAPAGVRAGYGGLEICSRIPQAVCLPLPWLPELRCIWGWGRGRGTPGEASVPASGKGRAILEEDRGLTGLWPPDPLLAISLGSGNS